MGTRYRRRGKRNSGCGVYINLGGHESGDALKIEIQRLVTGNGRLVGCRSDLQYFTSLEVDDVSSSTVKNESNLSPSVPRMFIIDQKDINVCRKHVTDSELPTFDFF